MRQVWTRALVGLLAVVAVVGLTSACEPRTGAAAYVNGTRVSESDVDRLVESNAKPFTSNGTSVDPRSFAVRQVVLGHVFERIVFVSGGTASAAELASAKAAVTTSDSDFTKVVTARGFKPAFEPILVHTQALLGILNTRLGSATEAQVKALIDKAAIDVKLNPQYGAWDLSKLSITNGPAVGDFLRASTAAS